MNLFAQNATTTPETSRWPFNAFQGRSGHVTHGMIDHAYDFFTKRFHHYPSATELHGSKPGSRLASAIVRNYGSLATYQAVRRINPCYDAITLSIGHPPSEDELKQFTEGQRVIAAIRHCAGSVEAYLQLRGLMPSKTPAYAAPPPSLPLSASLRLLQAAR